MLDLETQDLIALYALGALDPAERKHVEKLVEQNPEARSELKANLEVTQALGNQVPLQPAPDHLELKLMARVRALTTAPKALASIPQIRPATRVVIPWFARISLPIALAASVLAVWFGVQNQKISSDLKNLENQKTVLWDNFSVLQDQNTKLAGDLKILQDQKTTLSSIVADNRARVVALLAPDGKTIVGQAIITHDGRVLMAHNMGKLPPGKTWQAWFLPKKSSTPTSLGVFRGPSVAASIPIEVTAVGISEEPDGGSPKPTTPRAIARM
jgi:anti-sigma-K factor RskA